MFKNVSLFNYQKEFDSNQIIKISNFLEKPILNIDNNSYYINIDVTYNELLNNSETLVKELFYKLYYYKKNYFLFTYHRLEKLKYIPPLSQYLHQDNEIIKKYLYLEQLIKIIINTSTIVVYPTKEIVETKEDIFKTNKVIPLDSLNENQLKAINTIKGPSILLAPAGSGKTKTIVNRVVHLINEGVNPNNILVLAFNKKARDELDQRLNNKFSIKTNIKTFHSFGNQIVNKYLKYDFDIESNEKINIDIISSLVKGNYEYYVEIFSQIKNNLLTFDELEDKNILYLFERYIESCQQERFYNFDDMLYLAVKIILDNYDARDEIQKQYEYILIDEFQDLNKIQLMLIEIIAKFQDNIFVVGDDDQMIYRFRGASENVILNYKNNYSICNQYILNMNYRSCKNLIYHANQVIKYNRKRVDKDILAYQKNNGKIDLFVEENIEKESKKIVEYIKDAKNYNDIAILYRYNQHGDYLKVFLDVNNIPVKNYNIEILKTSIGSVIFEYLKLVLNAKPSGKTIQKCLLNYDSSFPYKFLNKITSLESLYDTSLIEILNDNQKDNYYSFIRKFKLVKLNLDIKLINLIKIFNISTDEEENLEIILKISNILGNISSFYQYFLKKKSFSNDGVILNTIHKTKGEEFENVIYYHVTKNKEYIEDERRLFYVAVTRAKKNLLITTSKDSKSDFIKEYILNEKFKNDNNMDLKLSVLRYENQIKELNKFKNECNIENQLIIKDKIIELKKELDYRKQLI